MFDETQSRIMDAAMEQIMERGYVATTTKEIAAKAGVNECTIFRRFGGKKEIVLAAMSTEKWNPGLKEADFVWIGEPETDLIEFSRTYMKKVTPQMVKVSMGLRTPELFSETAEGIVRVPQTFRQVLIRYFKEMHRIGKIKSTDFEGLAMTFLSMNFGFVFLKGSFGNKLTELEREQYIQESVRIFINGIA